MADNRMFLVYLPTGDAVYLGKRYGLEWYGTPHDIKDKIIALFHKVAELNIENPEYNVDDFALAQEGGVNKFTVTDWQYMNEEVSKLKIINND